MQKQNLYSNITKSKDEIFEALLKDKNLKLERIISTGQATPEGEWYDQEQNEWVVLLQGSAELRFENNEIIKLEPGDYVLLPSHCKHRVEKTSETETTIWLALHYF